MAANTSSPSENESSLGKKQSKALQRINAASSAPWLKPTFSELQRKDSDNLSSTCPVWSSSPTAKPDLSSMHSLSECLQLLHKLAEEVNNISQMKRGSKKAAPAGGSREPDSLEISRSLILNWAAELDQNMVNMKTRPTGEKTNRRQKEKTEEEKLNDKLQRWAEELRDVKEANGVSDDELKKLLYSSISNKSRMAAILPLLEFVTWSLLAEDSQDAISMMWLPTKQKAWRTGSGNPKYIPNSVWRWIQSAAVSFRLDVSTCHPWLAVSSDRLQLFEAAACPPAPSQSQSVSSEWPCVLGDAVISAGRHYWEVEVSSNGSWRIGVMSQSALSKKGSTVSPSRGFWTLWKASSFWACTNTPVNLEKATVPARIGVYVDVGEGQVSFYDAVQRVHIYTFSDSFKHSLIPVFGWLDENTLLKIRPADLSVTAQGIDV
ncbi:butyrophilin subfamily 3 member A1 isoform X1 [Labrus bergylta]|uniref:butyrophilin subfamily 3 member A1 isoform X1 n=1 Tax=Labrus bergylta TaxID=56723 RepID=UPI00331436D7